MADLFLQLDDVEGESLDLFHSGEIEFHQLKWALYNTATVYMSGSDFSQHASVDHIEIGKWVDNASPTLARMCAHGKHIPKGTITCRKNDGFSSKHEYFTIELENIKIDRVEWGARGEETNGIQETVQLSFLKFKIVYLKQQNDGYEDEAAGANEFPFSIPEQKSQAGKPGK
jgi:type VI secretion system secreted protein Hcp